MDRVLDSQVLDDIVRDFMERNLGNESVDISTEIPITTWHSVWEDTDDPGNEGTLEITRTMKV